MDYRCLFSLSIRSKVAGLAVLLGWTVAVSQGIAADSVYTFTHLAGPVGGPGWADGEGAEARFTYPHGVAVDASGNVYVADSWNATIRKISPEGMVTTLAGAVAEVGSADGAGGSARFNRPGRVAVDSTGTIYVADTGNHTIRKISPGGVVTTLAGGAGESGAIDATGIAARFDGPEGLAVDANGNVYVADSGNHSIRRIDPSGVVTTFAGSPGQSGSVDGAGAAARFQRPADVAVDAAGGIVVADSSNHTIRRIDAMGVVSTLAGQAGSKGSDDGIGTSAQFASPSGLAIDDEGDIWVADGGNAVIRRINSAGAVQTIVGGGPAGRDDGEFSLIILPPGKTGVRFRFPTGIAVNDAGAIYVADEQNHTIRKIGFTSPFGGSVTTLAGRAAGSGSADGAGTAATFYLPDGIAVDGAGNVYVADTVNSRIRKISPDGDVTTLAGRVNGHVDGQGSAAGFASPSGVAVDQAGNVYVAESATIRKVTPAGVVSTLVGSEAEAGNVDGMGSAARLQPAGNPAIDAAGNIYVAQGATHTVRKITPQGVVTTLAGTSGESGTSDGAGAAARFAAPRGVAVDGAGNLYVADSGNHAIRKITPAGVVTTLAGQAGESGDQDGVGPAAKFFRPQGIAVDAAGNVYVSDTNNHTIRRITPAGAVTTIGGVALFPSNSDGVGTAARFYQPAGMAIDADGNLYIADRFNHGIRKGGSAKVAPVLSWARPASLMYGAALSAAALNATANVPGTFTYSPANGTILPVGEHGLSVTFVPSDSAHYTTRTATVTLTVIARTPVFTASPESQAGEAGSVVTLVAAAGGSSEMNYRWWRNGVLTGDTGPMLTIAGLQPEATGLYRAEAVNEAGDVFSEPAIVGLLATDKVVGAGEVRGADILHPNGRYYDQVLLTGEAATITAEAGKVTRASFLDLDGDIVQIEFAGAGALSVVLAWATEPSEPQKYHQPGVAYMQGRAGIVIAGADETTNVSVFTVGRATAYDPNGVYDFMKSISETNDPDKNGSPLFEGHESTDYDGLADIAFIAISSSNGRFGGVRTGNVVYYSGSGVTGLYARGIDFHGPVFIGDINGDSNAVAELRLGAAQDEVRISGGSLWQGNGHAVQVSGITKLQFTAGQDSHGRVLQAQENRAVLMEDGADVTAQIVVNP